MFGNLHRFFHRLLITNHGGDWEIIKYSENYSEIIEGSQIFFRFYRFVTCLDG
jgi:hypothetical protein